MTAVADKWTYGPSGLRVRGDKIQHEDVIGTRTLTVRDATRRWPRDSDEWTFLRAHGFRRAAVSSTSGPSGVARQRHTEAVTVRLAPDDAAALRAHAAATGTTVAAAVTAWIRGGFQKST